MVVFSHIALKCRGSSNQHKDFCTCRKLSWISRGSGNLLFFFSPSTEQSLFLNDSPVRYNNEIKIAIVPGMIYYCKWPQSTFPGMHFYICLSQVAKQHKACIFGKSVKYMSSLWWSWPKTSITYPAVCLSSIKCDVMQHKCRRHD